MISVIIAVTALSFGQQMPETKKVTQQPKPPVVMDQLPPNPQPPINQEPNNKARQWAPVEVWLSAGVLCFGALIMALQTAVVVLSKTTWSSQAIVGLYALTLIITGSIVLVTAGYSAEQASPVMGLLGMITGYLLGSKPKE